MSQIKLKLKSKNPIKLRPRKPKFRKPIKQETIANVRLKHVDLFAGTGAFTLACQNNGCNTIFANDLCKNAKATYDLNFGTKHQLNLGDLNEVDVSTIPAHDILTGGFPCQPFSVAGKRKGFEDQRSNVFFKIMEIVDKHRPRFILLENVKNLKTHDKGNTFKRITHEITSRGYAMTHAVLNTSKYTGIPQNRERIFMLATRIKVNQKDLDNVLDLKPIEKNTLQSFFETSVPKKYYYGPRFKSWEMINKGVVKKNTAYQFRRVYVRENKNGNCPTLTANMGTGGHNVPLIRDDFGVRKLTPRECFNLQGFPADYKLPKLANSHLYKLAGNAVTYKLVNQIIQRLVDLCNHADPTRS